MNRAIKNSFNWNFMPFLWTSTYGDTGVIEYVPYTAIAMHPYKLEKSGRRRSCTCASHCAKLSFSRQAGLFGFFVVGKKSVKMPAKFGYWCVKAVS